MRAILQHRLASVPAMTAVVLLLPLLFPSGYYYRVAALVFVFALAATGLNLLMGLAGQVSLGHAGFMGIGAYAVAVGPTHLGVPSWLAFVMGAALSALVAYLVGRPILRLKGHYLAVATLGFGLLLAIVFSNEAGFTGGPDGMSVPRLVLFGWSLRGPDTWYWITAASFLIGATLALNLIDSPSGRALRAIHDSEVAARVLGVDVARKKLAVFVLSAIYASVAGSYFALLNGHITPDVSGFLRSIELVAMVVLGGMGSIAGSLVGAALLVVLPQTLTFLHDYEHMVLGLIVMAVMIFLRAGIVPTLTNALGGEARMTMLATEHLSIAFGGVHARRRREPGGRAGPRVLHHRSERRRQDDPVQHHLRPLPGAAGLRAARGRGCERARAGGARAPGLVTDIPEPADLLSHDRARERHGRTPPA